MSCEISYKCDHCGKKCSGDEYASIGRWEEPAAVIFGKTFHGCSKEHLGLALAKAFELPVDKLAAETIDRKNRQLEENINARNAAEVQLAQACAHITDLEKRLQDAADAYVELEKTLTPLSADGKTPGEVLYEARRNATLKRGVAFREPFTVYCYQKVDNDAIENEAAHAVLSAFAPDNVRQYVEAYEQAVREGLRAPSTRGLTGPKKPTKPITPDAIATEFAGTDYGANDIGCASVAVSLMRKRFDALVAYWDKGSAHDGFSEEYRRALSDCAKDLREAIGP